MSVYPDSDKVSVAPGIEADRLNALRLVRAGSVDYWHGEGNGPVSPATVTREPEDAPGRPLHNAGDLTIEPAEGCRWMSLGGAAGGERFDAAVLELDRGADFGPYRYEYGRELWLLLIAGTPTLQHADGERVMSPGDLACLPEGPAGGRRLINRSGETARVLLLWTTGFPAAVCYPETGEWLLRTAPGADEIRLRHR